MEAWRTRELIKEWNDRKLAHIAAMHSNQTWDDPQNQKNDRLQELEDFYESIKDEILMTPAERQEIAEAEDTPFMRASKRSVARAIESIPVEIEHPGEAAIRRLP